MASLRSLTLTTALAALASSAHGAAIETNPTSLVEDVVPLTHFHPAYGAAVADEVAAYEVREFKDDAPVVVVGANLTAADLATRGRSRMLESTNRDLQKLEEHFKAKMETNLKTLSSESFRKAALATAPWPSSYWPIYQDGINARWDAAQKSPAEKYALGFGLNAADFMDKVSKTNGVLSQKTRRKCKQTSDCDSLNDGSICGTRAGEAQGYCIPGWFGICHAWAPAAILEAEPKCAVARGNVTFQPLDIKALLTQVYDGAAIQTVFTGARFNGPNDPAKMDEFGRYTDAARRDLGPGFFHIAISNIMGKFKQSFVVDVTAGAEVWNQPVRNYEVVELKEMDVVEASQQFFKKDAYPFNPDAKKLAYVKTNFFWVVESLEDGPLVSTGRVDASTESASYEYLLELDGDGNIIGGEWLNDSRYNHPDFLWFPTGKPPANTVTSVGLKYSDVEQLLQDSLKCEQVVTPAPSTPAPTTPEPTTPEPTTPQPTTPQPTTPEPTTPEPTTPEPTTVEPTTTPLPTTVVPTTTPEPSTVAPTATPEPSTVEPTSTPLPTTVVPTTTPLPTTVEPTSTPLPTTVVPTTTPEPSTAEPTSTPLPTTVIPTTTPSTAEPTSTPLPTTAVPTDVPTTTVPSTTVPSTTVPSTTEPSTTTPAPTTTTPSTTVPATTVPSTTVPSTTVPSTTAPSSTPMPTTPSTDDSDDSEDDEPPATVSPQTPAPSQPPATVMPTEPPATTTPVPSTTTPATTTPATTTPATTTPSTTTPSPVPTTTTPSTDSPAQCGKSHVGVDFYGGDITQVYWVSQAECCDWCAQTDGCKAYTYVAQDTWGGASCYLKSGRGELRPKTGAISAEIAPSSSSDNNDESPVQVLPPSSQCATQRDNLDFHGADLKAVVATSVGECCDKCARHKRCKAFTLVGEVCYLKKGTGKPRFKLGAVSSVVVGANGQQVQM